MRSWRMEVTLVLAVMVLVIVCTSAQINHDLFEGDACKLANGAPGICQRAKNCPGFRQQIRGHRPPGSGNPPICSFIGTGPRSEPIICCGKTGQSLVSPNTPSTPVVGNRIGGAKSKRACDEYKRTKVKLCSVTPFILNGEDTAVGEFPHMALLGYRPRGNSQQLTWACGGALISDRYVLTAAHCLKGKDGPPVRVRLGEHDITVNDDAAKDVAVETVIVHPQYGRSNARSWYDDIGLIRLRTPMEFTCFIFPACLRAQPEEVVKDLIITGWGATTSTGGESTMSNVLQKGKGTLVLVPGQQCNRFYPVRQLGQRLANGIQPGMFCATDPNGQVDTCQGDSGGPIQLQEEADKNVDVFIYHVVGVTCSGPSICSGETPAIYTRVFQYLDWIEGIVWP